MLDKKEVAIVKRAIEVEWQVKKAMAVEEKLQAANDLLFQKDVKIEEEWQKPAMTMVEKAKLEKILRAEIESMEDATYVMFEVGFDKAVAQVKHFNANVSVDFFMVDWEKKLANDLI